jgi:hypothetical protein
MYGLPVDGREPVCVHILVLACRIERKTVACILRSLQINESKPASMLVSAHGPSGLAPVPQPNVVDAGHPT